ncbi:MAG: uncharacterized protein JWO36_5572 [Myxococcales bacterium]|nr:uncharacterized protein [Myxococcales bacterium]
MNRFLSITCLLIAACSSNSPNAGDDTSMPDASMSGLDPMKCAGFAQNFATAAQTCGSPLPAGAQTAFEGWCKKGVTAAAMCGGNPAAGLDCFASADPSDWVCFAGQPYPSCNGDLAAALGALCVIAVGNPSCASGIQCSFDADCSGSQICNSSTKQCMSKSAYCIGLPCTFDADCPTAEKCNSTEHACVGK